MSYTINSQPTHNMFRKIVYMSYRRDRRQSHLYITSFTYFLLSPCIFEIRYNLLDEKENDYVLVSKIL